MLSGTWPTLGGSEEIGLIADWMLVSNWVNSVARNFMIFFFFASGCQARERPLLTLQSVEDILGVSTRFASDMLLMVMVWMCWNLSCDMMIG